MTEKNTVVANLYTVEMRVIKDSRGYLEVFFCLFIWFLSFDANGHINHRSSY